MRSRHHSHPRMQNVKNFIQGKAIDVAGYWTPVIKKSKFKETGVITPEEFVAAGDHIVHHCPTWQWAEGDKVKEKAYLPAEKQFLITRNVPCYKRVKQVDSHLEQYEKVIEDDEDGGWVDTHHFAGQQQEAVSDMHGKGTQSGVSLAAADSADIADDDDEPAEDMEAFEESGMLDADDPATMDMLTETRHKEDHPTTAIGVSILQTRTYDLNITYDKFYQTPRLWISGYDEYKKLLTVADMYEDISEDHAHKTVTIEAHPHIAGATMASVHPCRHAEVMKKIIDTFEDGGADLGVHMYLLIFLKFLQAVIPTIEYDYTRHFTIPK